MLKLILLIISLQIGVTMNAENKEYRPLSPAEKRVIEEKGTERPFSGIYNDHQQEGVYNCKKCGTPLFESTDKFAANCGWPSFDDAIEGTVKEQIDADGRRTEIVCANCGGHLGHVFRGEGYTDKNTRHCVNSISLDFTPTSEINVKPLLPSTETAYFAAGCFWGVQYHLAQVEGVISSEVGYMGGDTDNPTYREVCSGTTGHAEALKVIFDPEQTDYEELAKLFFEIHDPTQLNRQGPDIGEQYRSAIFFDNQRQAAIARKLISILRDKGYDVVTAVLPAAEFYPAEEYHQDYYQKKGGNPYCHIYQKRF
ncbi:MAG: bifunctional methionine sulfoxide reductase B/A protein [Candidatus Cloacimonadales bacterium]